MKRIIYRSHPRYLDEDYTLDVNSVHDIVKQELERIRSLVKRKEDTMIDTTFNYIKVSDRAKAVTKSTGGNDQKDTLIEDGTISEKPLSIAEAAEILKMEEKDNPLDLNGALQITFPIAQSKYTGPITLKRPEIIQKLRRTYRDLGHPSWELCAAVFLHDQYNMDLYRISGGDRNYSPYEQFLYAFDGIQNALHYAYDSPTPSDLLDHLDIVKENFRDEKKILPVLTESLKNMKKKDLLNLYVKSLVHVNRLEITSEVVRERIRPEVNMALEGIRFVSSFKKKYAVVPQYTNGPHDTNLIRERLGDYIAQISGLTMALAKATISFPEMEMKAILASKKKDQVVGEFGAKQMDRDGYYEEKLERNLRDHYNFVYQRSFVVGRETTCKNGVYTRRIIHERRSMFPNITRMIEVLKYKNDHFIRLMSRPDIGVLVKQDILYPVEKAAEGIKSQAANVQNAVKILVGVISQEIDNFNLRVEKNFLGISFGMLTESEFVPVSVENPIPVEIPVPEELPTPEEISTPEGELVVPVVIDEHVGVPNITIRREENEKLCRLLTLSEYSMDKRNYSVFLECSEKDISTTTIFNAMRGILHDLGIPPAPYATALTKFLNQRKDLNGSFINMIPQKLLSEDDAMRLQAELASDGVRVLPVVFDPTNVLLGSIHYLDSAKAINVAQEMLSSNRDMEMIITNHLFSIGKDEKDNPILIGETNFFTRADLPRGDLFLVRKDGNEDLVMGDGLVKSARSDVRLL